MYSLQSRLGLWLGMMLITIFGVHIALMSYFPRYLAEEQVLRRLKHDADFLVKNIISQKNESIDKTTLTPIYKIPNSGHYFQLLYQNKIFRSPSLGERLFEIPALNGMESKVVRLHKPPQPPMLLWVNKIQIQGETLIIAVSEDIKNIEEDITEQQKIYFIISIITLLVLIFLQRLLIKRELKPVDQAQAQLLLIAKGEAERITQKVPDEIQPLVNEINNLLAVMRKRLERSRNATGNLAHALKTPLSVLTQLQDTPEISNYPDLVTEIKEISNSIQAPIDRELKRARLSGGVIPGQHFKINYEVLGLISVMEKVYAEKKLVFGVTIPTDKTYQTDREDMLEMLGNVLDNACKWAKSKVNIEINDNNKGLHILIEDDGKGIDTSIQQLTMRGTRLDEHKPGHGLGLSITKEIVKQYYGEITFDTSPTLEGLRVEITFPKK